MAGAFRLIDTGLRSGRENIAFDSAMVDARAAGEIPNSIRFIGFKPVALVGRHQAVSHEVNLDYCRANGVEIGRRITGGGAIYMDEGILGWALVCDRAAIGGGSLSEITRLICEAAAQGLCQLGVEARFRPRNDIEVAGRKISGTGGFFDGDVLMYQGTVLGTLAPGVMGAVLKIPKAKLEKRDLDDPAKRVVTLEELTGAPPDWAAVKAALAEAFGAHLGLRVEPGAISEQEETRARQIHDREIGADEFVYEIDQPERTPDIRTGAHASAGGTITCYLRLEGQAQRIRDVVFTGDFFVAPPRIVFDLEACLRGVPLAEADHRIKSFFGASQGGLLSLAPDDFSAAVSACRDQRA
jgi:lipoate-protein ligase A